MDFDIDYILEGTFDIGKKQLDENKSLAPQITIFADKTIIPMIFVDDTFDNSNTIKRIPLIVKGAWAKVLSEEPELKPIAIVLLADMWTRTMKKEEYQKQKLAGTYQIPSESSERSECLLVEISSEIETGTFILPYVRGQDKVVFAPNYEKKGSDMGFTKGLWPL